MSTVIKVENLSKQYRLGAVGTGSIAHDLNRTWYRLRGKEDPYLKIGEENDRSKKGSSEYVWALRDINFDVKQGEVLGIIGRNGAGKSTLLKILSRTTSPTTGSIKIKGRVASLLEVGTGFHPELTGRENIFLNGAILGMTKKEIKSKFDEIVDFAGVERYIDTPVKRYSSGMYVRLAFGVAAHLEPEILIVDEVLAVGDAEFQKKALGKMKDISQGQGRTVLFVSHNMGAIQRLCEKCLLLDKGKVERHNTVTDVINYFIGDNKSFSSNYENEKGVIQSISIQSESHQSKNLFTTNENIVISVKLNENTQSVLSNPELGIAFLDIHKNKIFTVKSIVEEGNYNSIKCNLPKKTLAPGNFSLDIALFKGKTRVVEYISDIMPFKIVDGGTEFSDFEGIDYGKVFVNVKWEQ